MAQVSDFFPLLQSLIGGLAAFGVAAYTVKKSSEHVRFQAEAREFESRAYERRRVLREKLEEVAEQIEHEYRQTTGMHRFVYEFGAYMLNKNLPEPVDEVWVRGPTQIERASVLTELYFPTLEDDVLRLDLALAASRQFIAAERVAITNDPAAWKEGAYKTFAERHVQSLRPATTLRRTVLNKSKELSVTEFSALVPEVSHQLRLKDTPGRTSPP